MNKKEPRIILFDIETMPIMSQVMKNFTGLSNYPGLTLKGNINSVICFGYKVFGEKETHCLNAWDFKSWKKDINDDKELVKKAAEILTEADAIVTHNGKRFDLKFLQTRLLGHGLGPIPKIPHLDTCAQARTSMLMFSNRLNSLGEFMAQDKKLENGGWSLWEKVMARDPKSMKLMTDYCKQDVRLLEKVYKKLLPFMAGVPNYNIFTGTNLHHCPACGSTRVIKNGYRHTNVGSYQRYICRDCNSWHTTNLKDKQPRKY